MREPVSRVKYWLVVEPKTATIEVGDSQQYRAYRHRSDNDVVLEVTNDAVWNIDEDIATMTDQGKYKGVRQGFWGWLPGDTHLYPTITYLSDMENNAILGAKYSDASEIAAWARPYVAAMTNANLVKGKGERFAPNDKMTRIEAAVLISNALKDVPGFGHPADLSVYTDADLIPAWAIGQVAEGTIGGYPDGSLRPNQPINRAESMVLLLKLLRGLGW